MVHSLIGLFCGVFGNAPRYAQLTHGVFDDIFRDLGPSGDLHFQRGHTTYCVLQRGRAGAVAGAEDPALRGADHPRHRPCSGPLWPAAGSSRSCSRPDTATSTSPRPAFATPRRRGPHLDGRLALLGSRASHPGRSRSSSRTWTRSTSPARVRSTWSSRSRGRARAAAARRAGLLLPRPRTAVLNVTHIEAPLDRSRPRGPSWPEGAGRCRDRAAAGGVPPGLRTGPGPRLRLPGPPGNPLDQGPPPAHRGRDPGRTRFGDAVARTAYRSSCTTAPTDTCGRRSSPTTSTTCRSAA